MTRKRWLLSTLFAAGFFTVGSLASREASAQERGFAVDKFDPSTRGSEWFTNDSLDLRGKFRPAFGLVLDYAYRPLTFKNAPPNDDTIAASVVRNQAFLHVGGSVVLFDRLRIGANLPVALENYGHPLHVGVVNFDSPAHEQGVGDLSVGADFRLLGVYGDPFTLALGAQVFLPTGSRDDYTSDGNVRFQPRLLAAGDVGAFVYAARFDVEYRGLTDDYGSVALGSTIGGGLSAGLRLADKKLVIGPEVSVETLLSPTPANPNTGLGGDGPGAAGTYLEGFFGAHYSVADFRFGLGGGAGFTRAYGTPVSRGLLSVEWTPRFDDDKDKDGIKDSQDACPTVAGVRTDDPKTNGCPPPPPPPDRDGDGILDSIDSCPDVPGVHSNDPKQNG
ncbi:MAG: thrombospondin type 3 repeat-containing protein, partial [Polyangiaceae bacterium]